METGKDLCCGPRSIGGFSRNGLFWCKLVSIERRRISLSTEMIHKNHKSRSFKAMIF